MPQYMLISQDSMEIPEGFEITPEIIQGIIQKYNDWADGLQQSGHLVGLNKLREDPGKNIVGFGANQVVTDGPYAETKELIGGYWIVNAANYDEAVKLASTCPSLEFGSRVEVREVEDLSSFSG
ncbi:MAG TPA: YciI family protein [Blastocatellia bacterium]|nr:YciI family protein [Blastocatellia bacterium]HMV82952.1 YciI family protein [Blastocatellia bacterium]HMX24637.1 YciI family protein [Blastocatellia bacterium]HMY71966.1 YciI family protein [Blastocatellia bacterium]HMZ17607.1 YciI family protein [Blastocatellia bacterium]